MGLRQINTCRKVPLQEIIFSLRHFALPSMSIIFQWSVSSIRRKKSSSGWTYSFIFYTDTHAGDNRGKYIIYQITQINNNVTIMYRKSQKMLQTNNIYIRKSSENYGYRERFFKIYSLTVQCADSVSNHIFVPVLLSFVETRDLKKDSSYTVIRAAIFKQSKGARRNRVGKG
jgi:hypothetical protein